MELVGKTIWDPPLLIEGRDGCLPYVPLKVSDNDPPLFVMLGRKGFGLGHRSLEVWA